jgi:hypothetical protein
MRRHVIASVVGAALLLSACGGGGDDKGSSAAAATSATTTAGTNAATTTTNPATELPQFMSDFSRVCSARVGFAGAASYEKAPGTHPIQLFSRDTPSDDFTQATHTLPAGWTITEDGNFENNQELAGVQLIGCVERTKTTPTGKKCDFDSDGKTITLDLVDATYTVTVYATSTAKQVGTFTLAADTQECPFVAAIEKGDTQYVDTPDDDAYTAALKQFVTPA